MELSEGVINELWLNILSRKEEILSDTAKCEILLRNKNKMILDIIYNNKMEFTAETYIMVAFLLHILFVLNIMIFVANKN